MHSILSAALCFSLSFLHDLRHEIAHLFHELELLYDFYTHWSLKIVGTPVSFQLCKRRPIWTFLSKVRLQMMPTITGNHLFMRSLIGIGFSRSTLSGDGATISFLTEMVDAEGCFNGTEWKR